MGNDVARQDVVWKKYYQWIKNKLISFLNYGLNNDLLLILESLYSVIEVPRYMSFNLYKKGVVQIFKITKLIL